MSDTQPPTSNSEKGKAPAVGLPGVMIPHTTPVETAGSVGEVSPAGPRKLTSEEMARRELAKKTERFKREKDELERVRSQQEQVTKEMERNKKKGEELEKRSRDLMAAVANQELAVLEARKTREKTTVEQVPDANILPKRMGPGEYAEYQRRLGDSLGGPDTPSTEHPASVSQLPPAVERVPAVQRQPAVQMAPVRSDQHPRPATSSLTRGLSFPEYQEIKRTCPDGWPLSDWLEYHSMITSAGGNGTGQSPQLSGKTPGREYSVGRGPREQSAWEESTSEDGNSSAGWHEPRSPRGRRGRGRGNPQFYFAKRSRRGGF